MLPLYNSFIFSVIVIILLLLTLVAVIYISVGVVDLFRTSAPFVPLRKGAILKLAEQINITSSSIVYDLGAGDGRVLYHIAFQKKLGKYIGAERSFIPWLLSFYYRFLLRGKSYNFLMENKNIFSVDLKDATHIIMYLFPKINQLLLEKFENELSKGTLVYVIDFKFNKKEPIKVVDLCTEKQNTFLGKTLYIYQF